jgi:flagellin
MASFGDFNRVNTNVTALSAQLSLNKINSDLGDSRLKLSTGKRINSAEDDSAGYAIATKLNSRVKGLEQALQNVSDAKSMLDVVEGAYNSIMDILVKMKTLATKASNQTLSLSDRTLINNQIEELANQINDVNIETKFNDSVSLLDLNSHSIQVGDDQEDVYQLELSKISINTLFDNPIYINGYTSLNGDANLGKSRYIDSSHILRNSDLGQTLPFEDPDGDLDHNGTRFLRVSTGLEQGGFIDQPMSAYGIVLHTETVGQSGYINDNNGDKGRISIQDNVVDHEDYNAFLGHIGFALNQMNSKVNEVGVHQRSLSSKEENLTQAITANSAAQSRIMDTDFAKEQSNSIRLQILQQTATAALSQANMGPQAVLGFLGQ